jgi:endonuclease YncB( thermonuclease family)
MRRRHVVRARRERLAAIALLAVTLGGTAGAAAQSGVPAAGNGTGFAPPGTGLTPAGSNPDADAIIGATDVLAPPETLTLDHPNVLTTARLAADATTVNLFGIDGEAGDAARDLQAYLEAAGDRVSCRPQGNTGYVCALPDGTDVAEVALANGAARATPEAPDAYREQELAAQTARRGLWANLPPPPETVRHPAVRDTATLASAARTYPLYGVTGLGAPYADELQDYIVAHGDRVTCSPQGDPDNYVCVLPDGTDVAKVALAIGAARAAPDAPDDYRAQQSDALNNRRGLWLAAPQETVAEALAAPPQTAYVLAAGDDGADGISYAGATPMAIIGGAPVFLAFAAGFGWGYWDHDRHWHVAPGAYRVHLDRFHPAGRGLPGFGYRRPGAQNAAALQPGNVFPHGSAQYRPPVRPGMPGVVEPAGISAHPAPPWPPGREGTAEPPRQDHFPSEPRIERPEMSGPAGRYPGGTAMAAPRFAPPSGGGFTNQRMAPQGSFHPGAPAQPVRAAEPPPRGNTAAARRQ